MSTVNPASRSSAHHSRTQLLVLEWASLLVGVLLCMPAEGHHPGLYPALLLLAASWGARWVRMRCPTRSTALDAPLLLFLLSLLISFLAAPDRGAAFARLVLHLAAISLFYALANSPLQSIERVLNLLIVMLALAGLVLTGQHDWSLEPARFSAVRQAGMLLNRLVPGLGLDLPPWNALRNMLASLLGLFLPILLVQLYRALRQVRTSPGARRGGLPDWLKPAVLLLAVPPFLLALLLTESRAPWVVYAAILALAAWWWLSQRIAERARLSRRVVFPVGIVLGLAGVLAFVNILARNERLLALMPGPDTLTGRLEISPQSSFLAGDTPYTGGGLGAFTALYSFYMRVTPFNAFLSEDTGSDLYHYIQVEQGWLGLASLVLLLAVPLYQGWVNIEREGTADRGLAAAGMAGVGIIILRGFIHAVLGASRAIPFLLLPAGLVFAGLGAGGEGLSQITGALRGRPALRRTAALAVPVLLLAALLALLLAPGARAAWHANLGALRMARVQLAGWPTEAWEDGSSLPALAPAEELFRKSLALDPGNRTANHRLGLIALLRRDFPAAVGFLERAYQAEPRHRGVTKSLGYALLWEGEMARGAALLEAIPEAAHELEAYVSWWNSLGRPDLAARAVEAGAILAAPAPAPGPDRP